MTDTTRNFNQLTREVENLNFKYSYQNTAINKQLDRINKQDLDIKDIRTVSETPVISNYAHGKLSSSQTAITLNTTETTTTISSNFVGSIVNSTFGSSQLTNIFTCGKKGVYNITFQCSVFLSNGHGTGDDAFVSAIISGPTDYETKISIRGEPASTTLNLTVNTFLNLDKDSQVSFKTKGKRDSGGTGTYQVLSDTWVNILWIGEQ